MVQKTGTVRVLTSNECLTMLEQKKRKKKAAEEEKEKCKKERDLRKKEKLAIYMHIKHYKMSVINV